MIPSVLVLDVVGDKLQHANYPFQALLLIGWPRLAIRHGIERRKPLCLGFPEILMGVTQARIHATAITLCERARAPSPSEQVLLRVHAPADDQGCGEGTRAMTPLH